MNNKLWISIIVILMMVEYIIFSWSYNLGSDKVLTDHVSFAGTIVSIILAVVAIIYSFIQTESQSRSSNQISAQVGSLRDVVKDIDLSRTQFSGELNRISEIASKLEVIDSHVNESHQVISNVSENMQAVMEAVEKGKAASIEPATPAQIQGAKQSEISIQVSDLIFASIDTVLLSYCLKLAAGGGLSENDMLLNRYSRPLAEMAFKQRHDGRNPDDTNFSEWQIEMHKKLWTALNNMRIFKKLGLITISEGSEVVTMGEQFSKVIASIEFDKMTTVNEELKAIAATFKT